jgi:hypothetical protein
MNYPPTIEQELNLRNKIINNLYSFSTIIVLKDIDQSAKFRVYLDAHIYEDTREILEIFS